jgi:hypothetical protein
MRGRDRDLVRPWKTGHRSGGQKSPLIVPASADATLSQKPEITTRALCEKPCLTRFPLLNPKMLAATLTYINCDAKLSKS